ncbi:MAG: Tim44 domain-containing protein [Alphaproteobacteria bacterium]|nr:Tim44 domain-containing protein [Alphaproteobacteria bacterium]
MMSHLDIIILLVVVFVVFQKLKSLLGTRPEEEKRVHLSKESAEKLYDLLIKEAEGKSLRSHQAAEVAEPEELTPVDTEEMSELDKTLAEIPNFSKVRFVDSAQQAFQVITEAFNNADVETLEMLVSKDILKKFQEVIEKRKGENISAETDFICFDKVEITKAEITAKGIARISVEFVSEQVNVLRDAEGNVIEGDENYIQNITDVWTFERALTSTTPNWILVSTKK